MIFTFNYSARTKYIEGRWPTTKNIFFNHYTNQRCRNYDSKVGAALRCWRNRTSFSWRYLRICLHRRNLKLWSMRRSSTHLPQRAVADGEPGPQIIPAKNRIAIRNPICDRAASGVTSVSRPPPRTAPPKIHFAPNFSARFPKISKLLKILGMHFEIFTSNSRRENTFLSKRKYE